MLFCFSSKNCLLYISENAKPWKDVVTTKEAFLKYPINSHGDAVWIRPFLGIIGCDTISITSKSNFLAILAVNAFNLSHWPIWYKRRYFFSLGEIAILSNISFPCQKELDQQP